jgi:sugar O-acyltransferase (sialic acid O-acetyltransferase NeuD family)
MKKLVIFGIGSAAELAHFYFSYDSEYSVVAFTVNAEYLKEDRFCGLPVVPFENIEISYKSSEYYLFVALGYSKLNAVRKEIYLSAKLLGYRLASYISSKSTLLNGGNIGDNCFILEDNTIQPFVRIGNNVTLWSGNHVGHHSIIGDHVFVASHVVISGGVVVGEQCFIGVNASLRDRVEVGERCVLGAGTLLLSSAAADGVYMGCETQRSKVPSTRLRSI